MADIRENVSAVIDGLKETLDKNSFTSVNTQSDSEYAYTSEKGTIKIVYEDNKILLYSTDLSYDEAQEGDYKRMALSLLEDESTPKDIKYIASDFAETINDTYADKKAVKKNNYKTPKAVSKTAARNGSVSYDTNTLASRICLIYPELKSVYKDNLEKYEEFLGEDFFVNHANKYIMDTLKSNDPMMMKKLFNVLNDIYENGSNEVQDVVAVTILGEIDNDQIILANCIDYMSDIMTPVVINVNKYLASASGKKAKKKLLNPPPYKPKKEKKKNDFMSQLGM